MSDQTLIEMLKEEEMLVADLEAWKNKERRAKFQQIGVAGRLRRLRRRILLVMDQEQARRTEDAMGEAMKRMEESNG